MWICTSLVVFTSIPAHVGTRCQLGWAWWNLPGSFHGLSTSWGLPGPHLMSRNMIPVKTRRSQTINYSIILTQENIIIMYYLGNLSLVKTSYIVQATLEEAGESSDAAGTHFRVQWFHIIPNFGSFLETKQKHHQRTWVFFSTCKPLIFRERSTKSIPCI